MNSSCCLIAREMNSYSAVKTFPGSTAVRTLVCRPLTTLMVAAELGMPGLFPQICRACIQVREKVQGRKEATVERRRFSPQPLNHPKP